MAKKIRAESSTVEPAIAGRLWVGILVPPGAWLVQLQALWLTSEYGCFTFDFMWNHVVSVLSILISAAATYIAYSEFTRWRADSTDKLEPSSRRKFMATAGMLAGVLFTLLIFAQWLPTLMEVPCNK